METTELAGILCARICHDLGSPIGAVLNGVDLIDEIGPDGAADELEMLKRSALRAAALLRFHRLAFGAVRDAKATLARDELCARASEVLAGPRLELACLAPEGPPLGAAAARLAALMLLAGRAMLGVTGTLRLMLPADAELPVSVLVEGPGAAASPERRRWIAERPGPPPDAPEVEFALLPAAARALGAHIELVEGEGQLALRALPG